MSALAVEPAVHETFDHVCHILRGRGRGRTLQDLAWAFDLAQALECETPDLARVCTLAADLGLALADLA